MMHLLEVTVIVGGVLALALMLFLSLPQSRLRDLLMPYIAWSFVVICGLYVASPIDALPEIVLGPFFGLFDDFAAVAAGVGTAMKTIRAKKQKHSARNDPYFNN